MTRRIIIDTDPGVDDLLAILAALTAPELEVVGLTTVFGNVSVDLTTTNALAILESAGRTDIPVARGAGGPLAGVFDGGVPHIHGRSGLGDHEPAPPTTMPVALDAADFINTRIGESPGRISLFAIGPLTNLAEAARRNPGLPHMVEELVIMGGNTFSPGNITPHAEANFFQDPTAADLVFSLDWPITMVGLDVTDPVTLDPEQIVRIGQGSDDLHRMLAAAMAGYQRFHERDVPGFRGICPHDATALCWMLRPDLFESVSGRIRVVTEGPERGRTVLLEDDEPTRPGVNIPNRVHAEAIASFLTDRLCNHERT